MCLGGARSSITPNQGKDVKALFKQDEKQVSPSFDFISTSRALRGYSATRGGRHTSGCLEQLLSVQAGTGKMRLIPVHRHLVSPTAPQATIWSCASFVPKHRAHIKGWLFSDIVHWVASPHWPECKGKGGRGSHQKGPQSWSLMPLLKRSYWAGLMAQQ